MKKEEFLQKLEESLEIQKLTTDTILDSISWDSLSIMIFIALVDKTFNISLVPANLKECQTVQDLIDVINNLQKHDQLQL